MRITEQFKYRERISTQTDRDTKKQKIFSIFSKLFWRGNLQITKHHHQDFRFNIWLTSSARVVFDLHFVRHDHRYV